MNMSEGPVTVNFPITAFGDMTSRMSVRWLHRQNVNLLVQNEHGFEAILIASVEHQNRLLIVMGIGFGIAFLLMLGACY